jgi:precorrin-4/cobalt-precorrin-4 C11-methyltransferase
MTARRGHVTIAGIGPGGSESLLTHQVGRLLGEADLVIFAGTMMSASVRELVRGELLFGTGFTDHLIRERVRDAVANGKLVAWLEPGDPSLYSGEPGWFGSLSENIAWLRDQHIEYDVLPGVSSLYALTSRLGLEHTDSASGTPLLIYAPGRDSLEVAEERLRTLCPYKLPMALYLVVEMLPRVVSIVKQYYGGNERIVVGYKVGWPDERIIDSTLERILDVTDGSDLARHTVVLLGAWRG